jgi:DNA-binding transcriptional LysR family regulator
LEKLRQRFPDLRPHVIAEDRRLDLIAEGIDLAISVGPLPDSSMRARRIGTLRDILCLAPHLMEEAPSRSDPGFVSWVQTLPYVAHRREGAIVKHTLPYTETKNNPDPSPDVQFRPALHGNTVEAVAAFARAGLGLALLPDVAIADDLSAGRLVSLCASQTPVPTPIYALHPFGGSPPKSVQGAITILARTLKEQQ